MSLINLPTISLPADLERFVEDQLALGRYTSAADVFCDGIRLLQEREQKLESLRSEVDRGLDQLNQGEFVELNSAEETQAFFQGLKARGHQRQSEQG